MLWLAVAAILAAAFHAIVSPVSGASSACSAYVYPREEAVDIKVASILGMHDADGDKCGTTYNAGALQVVHFTFQATISVCVCVRVGAYEFMSVCMCANVCASLVLCR